MFKNEKTTVRELALHLRTGATAGFGAWGEERRGFCPSSASVDCLTIEGGDLPFHAALRAQATGANDRGQPAELSTDQHSRNCGLRDFT